VKSAMEHDAHRCYRDDAVFPDAGGATVTSTLSQAPH
jgi:hypothetical protein